MWDKIYFNAQNIETETDKSILIKMPSKSAYEGMMFWHPTSLVREEGGKGYHLSFSLSDTWQFKVFKQYKNKTKREIILSPDQMREAFGISDEAIKRAVEAEESSREEHYLIVSEPAAIDKDVEVDESLKR